MGVAYKNLSVKSDFSQMCPSRCGVDSLREILDEIGDFGQMKNGILDSMFVQYVDNIWETQ